LKCNDNTIYLIGNSKSQQDNPITQVYGQFFMGFLVDGPTGLIVDVECNAIISLTNDILKCLFIGQNIISDYDSLRSKVEKRYLGSSQKAILVAFKDAQKKYIDYKSGKYVKLEF